MRLVFKTLSVRERCVYLCGEAVGVLGREITFIQSALAERQRRNAQTRIAAQLSASQWQDESS
jgi:hypothetical protein